MFGTKEPVKIKITLKLSAQRIPYVEIERSDSPDITQIHGDGSSEEITVGGV